MAFDKTRYPECVRKNSPMNETMSLEDEWYCKYGITLVFSIIFALFSIMLQYGQHVLRIFGTTDPVYYLVLFIFNLGTVSLPQLIDSYRVMVNKEDIVVTKFGTLFELFIAFILTGMSSSPFVSLCISLMTMSCFIYSLTYL